MWEEGKDLIGSSFLRSSPEELIHGGASALQFDLSVTCVFAVIALHADYLGSERPAPGRAVGSNGCVHTILLHRHRVGVLGEWNGNGMSREEDGVVAVLQTS